ncbi:hypothetical protein BKA83DRAFT_4122669 [Pisolithus microcarpus]|nr:hypothetical protein BKA83DRAFT_4122669 [Pisolithus microcarpus]
MWLSTAPVSEYLGDLCDLYDSDKRSHPLIRPKLRIFHCFLGVPQQLILVRFFGFFGPFLVIFFGKGVLILVRIFGFLGPFLVIFFSQSSLILIRIFGFLGPFLAIFFSQGALILVRIFCLLAPFLIIFLGWGTLCIFRIFGLLGYILGHNFVQCALTSAHICVQIIWDFVSIDILPFPLSFVLQPCPPLLHHPSMPIMLLARLNMINMSLVLLHPIINHMFLSMPFLLLLLPIPLCQFSNILAFLLPHNLTFQ